MVEHERRERSDEAASGDAPRAYHVARYLERLPLGTLYPEVAERVAAVVRGVVAAKSGDAPAFYVDATGVGTPIVDSLRAAGMSARLVPVYFTYGDRRKAEGGEFKLDKAWLVSRLQALLQSGLLHLPRTAEAEALGKELLDYEIGVTEDANDRYGAFRMGAHDDLVTALGLAVQEERAYAPATSDRSFGPFKAPPELPFSARDFEGFWYKVEEVLKNVGGSMTSYAEMGRERKKAQALYLELRVLGLDLHDDEDSEEPTGYRDEVGDLASLSPSQAERVNRRVEELEPGLIRILMMGKWDGDLSAIREEGEAA